MIDGEQVAFEACTINNDNYFKLQDVGQAMDFLVDWMSSDDEVKTMIVINTFANY